MASRDRPRIIAPIIDELFRKKIEILVHLFTQRKIAHGSQTCIVLCSRNEEARNVEVEMKYVEQDTMMVH